MKAFIAPLMELAEFETVQKKCKKEKGILQFAGCVNSQKTHMMYALGDGFDFKIIAVSSEMKAKQIYEEYRFLDNNVYLYPAKDLLFYQADLRGKYLLKQRMEVLQAISDRRSHRVYKKDQLPEEVLSAILKAGLEAPSARNRQPWHFSVVQNAELIQEVHDEAAKNMTAATGSPRFKDPEFQIFYYAPTVIFIFGEKEFYWSHVDCGIAVENMALAAEGLGIGSVILGLPLPAFKGDKADELRARLGCPEGYDFVVALALGYATDRKEAHDLREENISRII